MVLPSLLLLASFVAVGFAAPSSGWGGVDDTMDAFNDLITAIQKFDTDIKNYPGSMDVSFIIISSVFLFW
jgi:hypothetical protein